MAFLKELSFLIIESNTKARNRLRETLQNCVYKANIDQAHNLAFGLEQISQNKYHAAFISADEGIDEILNFIKGIGANSSTTNLPIIIKLSTDKQDSTYIAELLLGGAVGFICEPFSTSQLEKLLNLLTHFKNSKDKNDTDQTVILQAASLLITGAMQHIDELATSQVSNPNAGGYALKSLRKVSEMLKDLVSKVEQSTYDDLVVQKFIEVPAPRARNNKKRRKVEKVLHPGEIINEIIASRKLSITRLCEIGGIEEELLNNICQKKSAITKEVAESLARAIGRSEREWLALQAKFDNSQSKNRS